MIQSLIQILLADYALWSSVTLLELIVFFLDVTKFLEHFINVKSAVRFWNADITSIFSYLEFYLTTLYASGRFLVSIEIACLIGIYDVRFE